MLSWFEQEKKFYNLKALAQNYNASLKLRKT